MHILGMPWVLRSIACKGQRRRNAEGSSRGSGQLIQSRSGVEIGESEGHEIGFLIGEIDEQRKRDTQTELQGVESLPGSHSNDVAVGTFWVQGIRFTKGCLLNQIVRRETKGSTT